ncbi:MAG: NAD(P)/FAD-dependent oxidoreductase [Halioglobus sp.]
MTASTSKSAASSAEKPTEEFIRKALKSANFNALRVALYHQTKDPALASMKVIEFPVRGGALKAFAVAKEHYEEIREKAIQFLTSGQAAVPDPTEDEAAELMAIFKGSQPCSSELGFGWEDLAYKEFPRTANWKNGVPTEKLDDFQVTIIGAGISGIAAGIQLGKLGIKYRIVDRYKGVGGTWYLNDYPDARVDISTFLYQYKFEKHYPWKSYFATRDELKEYLEHVSDKYGVTPNTTLETKLTGANWDEKRKKWILGLEGPNGAHEEFESNVVISACGLFTTPQLPAVPAIETYAGKMFHTTAWDHDYNYADKKVALIGTGSTGVQLMPGIAEKCSELTVYQRTANWITPIEGYKAEVSEEKQWLLDNMPGYWNWFIHSSYVAELQIQDLQMVDQAWEANGGRVNKKNDLLAESLTQYIREKVGSRDDLFEKLVPKHAPLARRLVIDSGWYDALIQDNVELVTDDIDRFTANGIVTTDGKEREFDLIILSAGFQVSKYLWPVDYVGRNGATLEELWDKDGARAHMSITMPGFPNFFMMYGPNGNGRSGGFHSWSEMISRYICSLITEMVEEGASDVEVTREAFNTYNEDMDEAMKNLLWESQGQDGYYTNEEGRSGVNMPWTVHDFYEMIRQPDLEQYKFG